MMLPREEVIRLRRYYHCDVTGIDNGIFHILKEDVAENLTNKCATI